MESVSSNDYNSLSANFHYDPLLVFSWRECEVSGLEPKESRSLESDCLYKLCIYRAFFCSPGVMLKHLVICEQLLCCNVNWARQIILDTVSAPYCRSNLDLHSPFSAHGMHQMPGLRHFSGTARKPRSTALPLLSDVGELNPSLVTWSMLLLTSFVHHVIIL